MLIYIAFSLICLKYERKYQGIIIITVIIISVVITDYQTWSRGIECLSIKCGALSSNPFTTKEEKELINYNQKNLSE
jgi:hypothetical protein